MSRFFVGILGLVGKAVFSEGTTVSVQVPVKFAEKWWQPFAAADSTSAVTLFTRWDEKAGLQRDAIRSQCSTCSRHNEKETGDEED